MGKVNNMGIKELVKAIYRLNEIRLNGFLSIQDDGFGGKYIFTDQRPGALKLPEGYYFDGVSITNRGNTENPDEHDSFAVLTIQDM